MPETDRHGTAPASWQAGPRPLSASEEAVRRRAASWCLLEGIDPQAACQLAEVLAALAGRYGERLDAVRTLDGDAYGRLFEGRGRSPMAFALMGHPGEEGEAATLLVNRDFFGSPGCFHEWRDHNLAVADPSLEGVLAHEYAHLLAHRRRWPAQEAFAAFLAAGAEGLSEYARQDAGEMLAEAFALHEAGRWLPPCLSSLHGWFSAAEAEAARPAGGRNVPRTPCPAGGRNVPRAPCPAGGRNPARFSQGQEPQGEEPPLLGEDGERHLDAAWASLGRAAFAGGAGAKGDLDPQGRWVTVQGQHLHIASDGTIEAGGHPELRKAMEGSSGSGGAAKGGPGDGLPEPSWPKMARVDCQPHVREAFAKLLGREATDEVIAGLAGSEPGAVVGTGLSPSLPEGMKGTGPCLSVGTRTGEYRSVRLFFTGEDGKPACYNHMIHLKGDARPGGGLGTRVFARQAANLASLGFGAIHTLAVTAPPDEDPLRFLGAYTWPRLGYDGPVPPEARPLLDGPHAQAATMGELLAMPGGAKKWREANEKATDKIHFHGTFGLAEGSHSRRVLAAYLKEKKEAGKPVFSGWDESKHPRGADGKFATAQGGQGLAPWEVRRWVAPEDVDPSVRQAAAAWSAGFSEAERQAVKEYIGPGYYEMNKAMRQCPDTLDCLSPEDRERARLLSGILERAPVSEKPLVAWRGVCSSSPEKAQAIEAGLKAAMASGEPLSLGGFVSASLNPGTAAIMTNNSRVVLEMRGVRHGGYIGDLSAVPEEGELLLPPGTRWRVAASYEGVPFQQKPWDKDAPRRLMQESIRVYVLEPADDASAGLRPGAAVPARAEATTALAPPPGAASAPAGGLAGPAPAREPGGPPPGLSLARTPEEQARWHAARGAAGAALEGWLGQARAAGVRDEALAFYKAAASDTFDGMPAACLERFGRNVEKASFRDGLAAVTKEYGELAGKVPEAPVGGFWTYVPGDKKGELVLDGGRDSGEAYDMHGQSAEDERGIYAHEFAHAVDGTGKFHSRSPEWQAAWKEEVWRDKVDRSRHDWKRRAEDYPLTRYGAKNESEGFAEFGRLVFTRPEDAQRLFPKCWAVWQKRGLI